MAELIIDPGHGGRDPGAVAGKEYEKDWTLKISLYQEKRFKALGIPVAMTRTTDHTLESEERTKIVRDSGASFCFSNHLNAGGGDRGEVIHSLHSDGKFAHAVKEALLSVGQTAVKVYCRESAKSKAVDYYFMHRETGKVQTLIVEYCFLDNAADFAHFKANWEAYAEAVVRAYCTYTGRAYTPPGVVATKPAVSASTPVTNTELDAAIQYVKAAGISDGSNPQDTLTRGQFFRILYRMSQQTGGKA